MFVSALLARVREQMDDKFDHFIAADNAVLSAPVHEMLRICLKPAPNFETGATEEDTTNSACNIIQIHIGGCEQNETHTQRIMCTQISSRHLASLVRRWKRKITPATETFASADFERTGVLHIELSGGELSPARTHDIRQQTPPEQRAPMQNDHDTFRNY